MVFIFLEIPKSIIMINSKILSITLLIFTSTIIYSQDWILQNPFGRIGKIQSIDFTEQGVGYAVGQNGLIVTTENFGEIWTLREPPQLLNNRAVNIVDGSDGNIAYIGGQSTYKTIDRGLTWQRLSIPISNVVDIFELNEDNIFFASVQGKVYKTIDGGDSFIEIPVPYGRYESVYFIDQLNGWITGSIDSEGKILQTTDGGMTWTISSQSYDFIGRIKFLDAQIGFFHASEGLYKTTDGGLNWDIILDASSIDHMAIYDEDNIWVAWGIGFQKTNDGGLTWSGHTSAVKSPEYIYLHDLNNIWMGGSTTSIHHSSDGGLSWSDQIPGNKSTLHSIQFYNDQIGYAGNTDGQILKTINGGASWQESVIPDQPRVIELSLIDQDKLLVATDGGLYYSADASESWSNLAEGIVSSVIYINDNKIIYCKSSSILQTDISGSFHTELITGESFANVYFSNTQNGWATTWQGKLFGTTDGGDTWSLLFTQEDGDLLESIFFSNEQNGFILSSRYSEYILRTTDGGATWTSQELGISTFWGGGHFINETTGWIVGGTATTGIIYITEDGGDTWTRDFSFSRAFYDISAPIADEKLAWVSGAGGVIMRFSNCNTTPQIFDLSLPQAICQDDTISVNVGFQGIDIFDWDIPNGWSVFGNNNSSEIQIVVGEGAGDISVMGSNSCQESTEPLTQNVTSIDNPEAEIVQNGSVIRSLTTGSSYQWYRNGEIINGANGREYTPTETGNYYIKVGYNTGCISTPSNIVSMVISSTAILNGHEIILYPNPAKDRFSIKGYENFNRIELWSISGQFIKQYSKSVYYSLADISPGVYIIKLKSKKEIGILKIFVE